VTRRPHRRRRLVLRLYAFTAALSVAIMAALLVLPRYTRGPRYLEPQAALFQFLVERWSLKDQKELDVAVARLEPRLRGGLTLYATSDGHVVRSSEQPPLEPPTPEELATLKTEKWALDWSRIVVRSDDGAMIGVYEPTRPGFPWSWVLPLGAIILVVVGGATLWFTRRLALPLGHLADAAEAFGGGDTTARANIRRDDEVGDVGRAFDEMADRTASLISSQRQLMADVSHELRTPLARIRVALELVVEDPVAARDVLADVTCDLDEIDQLIGDILTTARLDAEAVIKRTDTPVDDVAAHAQKRFTARHPKRQLERPATPSAADANIACDPQLLRRALDNLLDNAAKYSEPATPVRLVVTPNGESVAFEVIDRGIGMSAEELEHAFTPFWRADSSRARKTGGVGLGLALARRIARAHGGDVTLVSAPGQGTTAKLVVPKATPPA
jgi:signal transduction histidine kinase